MRTGEVSHDVATLSGTPLNQFTQPVELLRYQKISSATKGLRLMWKLAPCKRGLSLQTR